VKALSLSQPYAWLVLQRAEEADPRKPLKPIENRSWPLPKNFTVPQRIWIHASLGLYNVTLAALKEVMTPTQSLRCANHLYAIYKDYETYRHQKVHLQRTGNFGCILGSIVVTGQVTASENVWFLGPYGYTLEYPEMLPKPIPYKGQLGFFEVPDSIVH
jgi:hypothetical protein